MKPLGALGVLACVVVVSRSVLASCTRISYIVDWQGTAVYAFLQSDRLRLLATTKRIERYV